MAVTTTKEFLAVCGKCGLLDDDQQAEAEQWTKQTDDPKRMAATMAKREWVTRWQAHQLLNGRKTFTMGKYQLIDLLGRRGMGNVFLAQHTTMNRKVALKIVSKKIGQDPQLLKRFLDEARAIATLDHDNIVRAYSVDKEGDCYYIVMEYVEGRDLEDIVRHDGPLDSETAAAFIQQAADGLAHAHEKELIHGDIKPSSLLMAADGTLKITDVGISEFTFGNKYDSGEQKQLEPIAVNYTAPELSGDDPLPDPRSDIYSLGCTLYFLLTGQPPFPKGSALERMEKHRSEAPEPILNKRPDVSKNLAKVCRKMMAKDAAERFRAAGVVQKVLAEVVQMEQANRRKSTEDAAPPPPRDAKAPAPVIAVARGKGNGEPAGKKKSAIPAKMKRAPAAAAAATDDAGGKPAAGKKKAAAAPAKKKSAGGPAFDFLEKSDTETAGAAPTIQVGKRRKKTAAKPAKAAAAVAVAASPAKAQTAAADPGAAPARQAGSKSSLFQRNPRWLIIGGAIALCLLLAGGGVAGTIWFFSGDDDDETVAEEDGSGNDGQATTDDEGGSADRDDEGGSVGRDDEGGSVRDDEGDEPGSGEVAVDSPTDGSDEAMASADGTDDPESPDGTPLGDGGTTDDPSEESQDDETDGDDPGDDGGNDPSAGDGSTTSEEPDESTPEEDPPPVDEPKEEPKPPPKPKNPFKDFTPDVTLAAADADGGADPQKLTAVEVADDTIWFVTLLGGEDIGKGKQLKLNANGEDGGKARWTLDLETPAKGQVAASTAQVGNVWYEGGSLMFQWTKEGTDVPAGVMESCLVQIDVEAESRTLSMIKPQMVEPLVIDFQKKAAPVKIEFENLPDSDKLKLEITRLEGVKEEMQLEPNGPVPVRKPLHVRVMFTTILSKNLLPGAAFQVNMAEYRGNLTVSHRLTGSIASVPNVQAALQKMRAGFPLAPDAKNAVSDEIKRLEGMMKGKQGKGLRGEDRVKVQQGIDMAGTVLWFDDFVKAVDGVGKIHYRIFMEIEGRQVDIVRTEPPKPADAGKKGGDK